MGETGRPSIYRNRNAARTDPATALDRTAGLALPVAFPITASSGAHGSGRGGIFCLLMPLQLRHLYTLARPELKLSSWATHPTRLRIWYPPLDRPRNGECAGRAADARAAVCVAAADGLRLAPSGETSWRTTPNCPRRGVSLSLLGPDPLAVEQVFDHSHLNRPMTRPSYDPDQVSQIHRHGT